MSERSDLFEIEERAAKLHIERNLAIERALSSSDVDQIFKAQQYLQGIAKRQEINNKSILFDPSGIDSSQGYRTKPVNVSFDMLRGMARTPIIKAIIATRRDQVKAFCEPQRDKFSTGFIIDKKRNYRAHTKAATLSKEDEAKIDEMYEFVLNCGKIENFWHSDTFETFIGKITEDSLTLDQATAECIRNVGKELIEFFATDGATYRVADSIDPSKAKPGELENGYAPTHVQIYDGKIQAEFYPWELMFGIRNPSTNIRTAGYGRAELEDMIQTVTALLNSDFYNANFFQVGSAPKGLLRYSGNINQNTVEEFRRGWQSQLAGVTNMHKIPIVNADKLEFVNLQQSNKDMEFSKYQEFLIKIGCAQYRIDPSEIGFPMSGSSEGKPMFEGNNEARLKYSKDKGLKPLLKHLQNWVNKWIVQQKDPTLEFRFVGIDDLEDAETDLERDIKALANFETLNEVRKRRNLKPIPGMDIVLNQIAFQKAQQDQEEEDPNPFEKALVNDIGKLLVA